MEHNIASTLDEALVKWPKVEIGRAENLTNKKFVKLTPLYRTQGSPAAYWVCQCDCGKFKKVKANNLKTSRVTSCGCKYFIDRTGDILNHYLFIEPTEKRTGSEVVWKVKNLITNEYEEHIANVIKRDPNMAYPNKTRAIDRKGIELNNYLFLSPTDKRTGSNVVWKVKNLITNEIEEHTYDNIKRFPNMAYSYGHNSVGEEKIKQYLKQLNIVFHQEYGFSDCKYINKLRFDFYLPDYNCCIEFDGKQHFKEKGTWAEKDNGLKEIQIKDNIKNQYCKNNNIKLIRIPYWDIDKINEKYLMNLIICEMSY